MLEFIQKNGYELGNVLEYNSYRTGARSEIRNHDSISVTELLKLIIDPNMNMVESLFQTSLEEAKNYWTLVHLNLEKYFHTKELPDEKIYMNFRKALIQNDIELLESEKDYDLMIGLPFPLTAKIDTIIKCWDKVGPMDYKASRKIRNFVSMKYQLQLELYKYLSNYDYSWNLYLNSKDYIFIETGEHRLVILDLIEYARQLYSQWRVKNLFLNHI